MSQILQNVDIAPYTTFRMGGQARFFSIATTPADLPALFNFATENAVKTFILGGGSNIIVTDEPLEISAIKIEIGGIEIIEDKAKYSLVKIGAGIEWDKAVAWAVKHGLAGIEAMSAIPGTCGATPIQNVGAYGQEIKDSLVSLAAYDRQTAKLVTLTNKDCDFHYRDSFFKHQAKDRYVICDITLKLSKNAPKVPNYPAVKSYFAENKILKPSLDDLRQAIISIRAEKMPDPKTIPSVGSFFKNPIVNKKTFKDLQKKWPGIINFPAENNKVKLGAGWLIDQCGLKGFTRDSLATHQNNALVITNNGQATFDEVINFVREITRTVNNKFGINLEPEPIFVK